MLFESCLLANERAAQRGLTNRKAEESGGGSKGSRHANIQGRSGWVGLQVHKLNILLNPNIKVGLLTIVKYL